MFYYTYYCYFLKVVVVYYLGKDVLHLFVLQNITLTV